MGNRWEQKRDKLAEERIIRGPEVQRDEDGQVIEESLPEPMSAAERLAKFQEIIEGGHVGETNFGPSEAD